MSLLVFRRHTTKVTTGAGTVRQRLRLSSRIVGVASSGFTFVPKYGNILV